MRPIPLALTVVLAATALADLASVRSQRAETSEFLETTLADLSHLPELGSEPDPIELEVLAARAVLQDALRPFPETLSTDALTEASSRRADQLSEVRRRAGTAAAERPSNWQAHMLLGASTYLERSLRQDRELFTSAQDWEAPLQRAIDLYPRSEEPERFLTMAYLEIWPMLSGQKRELTRQLLRTAMDDPTTFNRYIGPWLSVNDDLDEAMSLLPKRTFVWREMLRVHRASGDWRRYVLAQNALEEATRVEIDARFVEATERLKLGDLKRGRSLLIEIAGSLPIGGSSSELLDRTLTLLPPGPIHSVPARNVTGWLHWALEQCSFRDCPLSPTSLQRAAVISSEERDSFRAAAFAASGDLVAAEALAARTADLSANEWSLYHLIRAREYAASGRSADAREALARVNREQTLELGRAALLAQLAESDRADPKSRAAETSSWEWRQTLESEWTLDLYVEADLPKLELAVQRLPERGCPLEVWLDGEVVQRSVITPRRPTLEVEPVVPLLAGPHRVAIRSPAGCYFLPASTLLRT